MRVEQEQDRREDEPTACTNDRPKRAESDAKQSEKDGDGETKRHRCSIVSMSLWLATSDASGVRNSHKPT